MTNLEQEHKSIDKTQPGVGHEEEDEVSTLGVHEAAGEIVDHGDVASLPGPDHDHYDQIGRAHV